MKNALMGSSDFPFHFGLLLRTTSHDQSRDYSDLPLLIEAETGMPQRRAEIIPDPEYSRWGLFKKLAFDHGN